MRLLADFRCVKTNIRYTCSGNGGYNLTKKLQHKHDKTLCFNGLLHLPFTFCVFFWRIQEKAVILHSETRPKDSLTEAILSAKPEGDERREVILKRQIVLALPSARIRIRRLYINHMLRIYDSYIFAENTMTKI